MAGALLVAVAVGQIEVDDLYFTGAVVEWAVQTKDRGVGCGVCMLRNKRDCDASEVRQKADDHARRDNTDNDDEKKCTGITHGSCHPGHRCADGEMSLMHCQAFVASEGPVAETVISTNLLFSCMSV